MSTIPRTLVIAVSLIVLRCMDAGAATSPLPGTESPANLAAHLLQEAREATGGAQWDSAHFAHITAKLSDAGQTSKRECWLDLHLGRASCVTDDGPEAGRWGYDGKDSWFADLEGVQVEAIETPLVAIQEAWWRTAGWSRALPPGVTAVWRGEERLGGRLAERVEINFAPAPLTLWLDRSDHLPLRVAQNVAGGVRTIRLSGWRHKDEVALPRHVEITTPGHGAEIEVVQGMDLNHPVDPAHFARPTERIADYQFPGDAASATVPLKLSSGHYFVDVMVEKQRLLFKLDTTSPALIDRAAAQRLGLVDNSEAPLGATVRPRDFRVAGIAFRHFALHLADLTSMTAAEGIIVPVAHPDDPREPYRLVPVDGVIGADLVRRLIVEFDREGGRLVFFKAKGFIPPQGASPLPLTLVNGVATVAGRVDGIETKLAIDSGSAASLILPRAFPTEHSLEKKWPIAPAAPGPAETVDPVLIAQAASVELGVFAVAKPVVSLRDLPQSAPRMGGDLLRRFDAILDVKDGKFWLQQDRNYDQPDAYDQSGLSLSTDGHSVTVSAVLADSPAARAHIKPGAKIVSIGTARTISMGLSAIRERLAGLYGPVLTLGIAHDGSEKPEFVRLPLRDPLSAEAIRAAVQSN